MRVQKKAKPKVYYKKFFGEYSFKYEKINRFGEKEVIKQSYTGCSFRDALREFKYEAGLSGKFIDLVKI